MDLKAWFYPRNQRRNSDRSSRDNRFLIAISVVGSTGPLRFVVKRDDSVAEVIGMALKVYDREGRLPVFSSDTTCFLLYTANVGSDALDRKEAIGSHGVRNFVLCKNDKKPNMTEACARVIDMQKGSRWCAWAWLQKSLIVRILSH